MKRKLPLFELFVQAINIGFETLHQLRILWQGHDVGVALEAEISATGRLLVMLKGGATNSYELAFPNVPVLQGMNVTGPELV